MGIGASGRLCLPCTVGRYANGSTLERTTLDACKRCSEWQEHTTTFGDAAPSEAECVCEKDYYHSSFSENWCDICPEGAMCIDLNTTLDTLKAKKGFWRPSTRTHTFKPCNLSHNYNTCKGGNMSGQTDYTPDFNTLCFDGFEGPFCDRCADNSTYIVTRGDETYCAACPPWGSYFGFGILVLVIVLSLWCFCVRWSRRRARINDQADYKGPLAARAVDSIFTALLHIGTVLSDNRTKIKILWTFYQIVGHIPETYDVTFHEPLHAILEVERAVFSKFIIFDMDFLHLPVLRLDCIGIIFGITPKLADQLIFANVAPIAFGLLLILFVKLRGHGAVHAIHLILGWSFFVYPTVVAMGFNTLKECECWDNVDGTKDCFLKYDKRELADAQGNDSLRQH